MYLIFILFSIIILLGVSQLKFSKFRNEKIMINVPKIFFVVSIVISGLCSDFFMGLFLFFSIMMPIFIWILIFKPYGEKFFRKNVLKKIFMFFMIPVILISIGVIINKNLMDKWEPEDFLVGNWNGRVKYNDPNLKNSEDIVLKLSIDNDGIVEGNIGDKEFENCKVYLNRNSFERFIMVKTDYRVDGFIDEGLVDKDGSKDMEINVPFNFKDESLKGSIFYIKGMEYPYPIVTRMELKKE